MGLKQLTLILLFLIVPIITIGQSRKPASVNDLLLKNDKSWNELVKNIDRMIREYKAVVKERNDLVDRLIIYRSEVQRLSNGKYNDTSYGITSKGDTVDMVMWFSEEKFMKLNNIKIAK